MKPCLRFEKGQLMKRILMAWVLASLAIQTLSAETYSIDWHAVAGGGGTSSGGNYVLSGTIGQAESGTTLAGGQYTVQGGFWAGVVLASSGEIPQLFIQLSGADVVVSWMPAAPGFVLEMAMELGSGEWLPGPAGNPVAVPVTEAATFYRLRRD
jgi:hypothetical protein